MNTISMYKQPLSGHTSLALFPSGFLTKWKKASKNTFGSFIDFGWTYGRQKKRIKVKGTAIDSARTKHYSKYHKLFSRHWKYFYQKVTGQQSYWQKINACCSLKKKDIAWPRISRTNMLDVFVSFRFVYLKSCTLVTAININ